MPKNKELQSALKKYESTVARAHKNRNTLISTIHEQAIGRAKIFGKKPIKCPRSLLESEEKYLIENARNECRKIIGVAQQTFNERA